MVLDLILPILVELVTNPIKQYIVTPITRRVGYAFKCSSKVQTLQDEVIQLKNKKDRLQQSVDEASRNGEQIYPNVTEWLSNADKAIGDAEELVQQKDEEAKNKCFVRFCPNLKTRYQLGKAAEKKALAIDKLRNEEGLDSMSFRPPLQQILEPSVYTREALPSRVLMLNQIMDALRDPNLNMIGVYGMGGVGKTTLAKEVQAKAIEEKLFETVVVVAVSQTPELRRIQAEIADFLGLKFDAEELPGRASQLYKRLEEAKVLIILDDLWQKLDLNAIGIPFGDASKGRKLMLTSRSKDLLSNEMCAQKLFSLETLKDDETWSLFQMSAVEARDPKFYAIATEIAKKCAGLPLLIQLVATELQNKESFVWNDKLHQLSSFGDEEIYERVYKVLESSYENLPGNEAKSFFLLCALFGQSNIRIQYLLTHSLGLGLFKQTRTIESARDKVFTLINKLKDKSLLLDGDMIGFVKMHDVVRDSALSIASRVQHAFIGSCDIRSSDWPNRECTRISFPYSGVSELPVGLHCPQAQLFLLFTEDLSLEIPDSFFEGINKLRAMEFTGMRLLSLPSSIGLLTNLQTLCLHRCRLDNVAMVGELKQLESLSFAHSKIRELPREVEALTRLKLLDLGNCSDLQVIPENVLSTLCSLEELYMLNSFDRWNAIGNASLVELESLSHLSTLEIQIVNPKLIPDGCRFFHGLRSYKISIGSEWGYCGGNDDRSRTLKIKIDAGIHLEDGIKVLLRGADDLYLSASRGIESVLYDLDRAGFPQLKHLDIQNDYGIQHMIKSTMRASCNAFPILESLNLKNVMSLEKICYDRLGMGSFGELRLIKISGCDKLKTLFSVSSAKCLVKLQELEVDSCENVEAVIGEGSEDEHDNEVIEFNQLSSLKLTRLPHLKGFCKIKEGSVRAELLFSEMVYFPSLISLEVYTCKSLKHVFTPSVVKSLVQLKKLDIGNCELVEEIVRSKKDEELEEESIKAIVFPKLDHLSLSHLRNVKTFSCGYSIEFPLLRELEIWNCTVMKNFVSKFTSDESEEEYLFNEMVTFPNLEMMRVDCMNIKCLWDEQFTADGDDSFPKLKSLKIQNCSKISVVIPSNAYRIYQKLEVLHIHRCDGVEEIYEHHPIDFKEINNVPVFALRDLLIWGLPSLKNIWSNDPQGSTNTFENLQSVYVTDSSDLKYVFPASIARGLFQLQKLTISNCENVEAIIAKEKDGRFEGRSFQFPELIMLELVKLRELRRLCEGPHTFECPKLKTLEVKKVPNIFVDKFNGNLEELRIDGQGVDAIQQSAELVYKVQKLTVESFTEESVPVVFGFLRRLKSLEMLVFSSCYLEEEQLHHLISLKHLELSYCWRLKHIARKKDSQFIHILQHLHTLNINGCRDLMDIAPFPASFHNLTTLHVDYCRNINNLVTASTAKTMVHLMELKVKSCEVIEEIVTKDDGDDTPHDHVIIFKKLKHLELQDLPKLQSFCSKNYTFDFPLLGQVTLKRCPRMRIFCAGVLSTPKLRGTLSEDEHQWEGNLNVTTQSQMRKWVGEHLEEGRFFRNVESLHVVKDAFCSKAILVNQMQLLNKLRKITVRDCDSVQVVFDLEGLSDEYEHVRPLPPLNKLRLVNLPMLSQLCNKALVGILDLKKLEVLKIYNCSRLEYVFTWSMASCLFNLQEIELKTCEMMETIVKEEEAEDATAQVICFGSLKSIVLECLPKFSSIYSGSCDLECPLLNKISIRKCPRLTREYIEGTEEHNLIRFSHKVLPKLKSLSLDIKFMVLRLPTSFFPEVEELVLEYSSATATLHRSLLQFLSRLPNVIELGVCNSSLQDLFTFGDLSNDLEEVTTLPQIKTLRLKELDDLKCIWWPNSLQHASLFQSLQTLEVKSCGNLINLASGSTSFQNLTTLEVCECNQLRNLITSSVAKSMVQLEKLTVRSCKMLLEIVGDINGGTTEEIVFAKMKELELNDLQSLKSFSLGHCTFKFPCLVQVSVHKCPNMRVIFLGNISTPMLNHVQDIRYDPNSFWQGNLNNTIEQIYKTMVGFQGLNDVKISMFPTLKDKWDGQFSFEYFYWLERLVVDDCAIISNAISSHLLRHLQNLKVLIVEKCDLLEQVFELEGLNAIGCGIKRMKNLNELHLIDLPKLTDVWSKDPQQIMSFENLHLLKVHNCGNLTFIFDLSMASSLPNLQHLEVKNCSLVEHVVAQGEDEKMLKHQMIFPSLQSMNLQYLTNLLSFYSASGFLECSSLKMIEVFECPNMELFGSTPSNGQDSCMVPEDNKELISSEILFLGNKIGIPGLEELKVEWNSLKGILYGDIQPEFINRLKRIELTGFQGEEYAIMPSNFLQHFPNLEKLALSDASFEELNLQELNFPEVKDSESLELLTKLKLSNLPKLKHLVRDDSQLVPLFQKLTNLEVSKCHGLVNLMTASTARSLVQLKRINVKDCKVMQEILAIGSDGVEYEIRFNQLEYLELDDLPCLTSFCSGNYAFHFPSLKEVMVKGCSNMKIFVEQVPITPKLRKVKTGRHEYDWEWEGSLNSTVQTLFLGKDVEEMNT